MALVCFHAWSWLYGPMRPYQHGFFTNTRHTVRVLHSHRESHHIGLSLQWTLHICKSPCKRIYEWNGWVLFYPSTKHEHGFDISDRFQFRWNSSTNIFSFRSSILREREREIIVIKCIICINCPRGIRDAISNELNEARGKWWRKRKTWLTNEWFADFKRLLIFFASRNNFNVQFEDMTAGYVEI